MPEERPHDRPHDVFRRFLMGVVRGIVHLSKPLRGSGISNWWGIRHLVHGISGRLLPENRLVEIHGHVVELHRMDAGATTRYVLEGRFEEPETEFLQAHLKAGMTAFDIGANIGLHTLTMADAVGPSGKVFAFEPAAANLDLLRRNIERNGVGDRTRIIDKAVCDTTEAVRFWLHDTSHGQHQLAVDDEKMHAAIEVPATTIDTFIAEEKVSPDLIKIDVEGAEPRVLRGMQGLLESGRPVVILAEYWPPASSKSLPEAEQFASTLEQFGFTSQVLNEFKTGRGNYAWIRRRG